MRYSITSSARARTDGGMGAGARLRRHCATKAHRRIFARKVSEISTTPAAVSGRVLMAALQVERVGSIARYFPRLPPPTC